MRSRGSLVIVPTQQPCKTLFLKHFPNRSGADLVAEGLHLDLNVIDGIVFLPHSDNQIVNLRLFGGGLSASFNLPKKPVLRLAPELMTDDPEVSWTVSKSSGNRGRRFIAEVEGPQSLILTLNWVGRVQKETLEICYVICVLKRHEKYYHIGELSSRGK
ncbi:MAG: hypothetical protein Q8O19_00805 [Rectinemataceae bacterium]|nr:hypothetical protein [Rectinemataceae bacterium]